MDVSRLIARIEQHAPLALAAPWDKSGVQIAAGRTEVTKLALALDPLPERVAQALSWGADFILTHHPLSLDPRFLDSLDSFHEVARQILASEVWLYAAHTSLDVQSRGPVSWLAKELKLQNIQVLDPISVVGEADEGNRGYGLVGDLPESMAMDELSTSLAQLTGRDFCLIYGHAPERVDRLAYCPGSGASLAAKAHAAGAQVFVTGEMKYHPALELEGCVLDVGHFGLEEEMIRRFGDLLAADPELKQLECRFFPGQDPQRVLLAGGHG